MELEILLLSCLLIGLGSAAIAECLIRLCDIMRDKKHQKEAKEIRHGRTL
jgi:hypothetical protein